MPVRKNDFFFLTLGIVLFHNAQVFAIPDSTSLPRAFWLEWRQRKRAREQEKNRNKNQMQHLGGENEVF